MRSSENGPLIAWSALCFLICYKLVMNTFYSISYYRSFAMRFAFALVDFITNRLPSVVIPLVISRATCLLLFLKMMYLVMFFQVYSRWIYTPFTMSQKYGPWEAECAKPGWLSTTLSATLQWWICWWSASTGTNNDNTVDNVNLPAQLSKKVEKWPLREPILALSRNGEFERGGPNPHSSLNSTPLNNRSAKKPGVIMKL